MASYRSLGKNAVTDTQQSRVPAADLASNSTILAVSAVPNTVSAQLSVGGTTVTPEIYTNTSGLNEN